MQETAQLHCPIDQHPLLELPHGQSSFHRCETCSGIWVSRPFLIGLASRRDEELTGNLNQLPPPTHRKNPLNCPQCNYLMPQRIEKSVQIDICPHCKAVWLDGGEVVHIGNAIRKTDYDTKGPGRIEPLSHYEKQHDALPYDPDDKTGLLYALLGFLAQPIVIRLLIK